MSQKGCWVKFQEKATVSGPGLRRLENSSRLSPRRNGQRFDLIEPWIAEYV